MKVLVRAPSNIALVKYMGKTDGKNGDLSTNIPENPSLSLTLSALCTFVEMSVLAGPSREHRFIAEVPDHAKGEAPLLSSAGLQKYMRHLLRCESRMAELFAPFQLTARSEFPGACTLRTSNTFPSAAGIASSASSFAGLTLAAAAVLAADSDLFLTTYRKNSEFRAALAALSREGSGSSCRSFEGPFVAWDGEGVKAVESHLPPLSDLVVVVSALEKKVGSSEAHRRVKSSPNWVGRTSRATERFQNLKIALVKNDFSALATIARADSKDMHELFATSVPPFSYLEKGSKQVLDFFKQEHPDAVVVVTLDAGPNVHLIVPQSEESHWKRVLNLRFPEFPILVDREGAGAEILEIRK